MTEKTQIHLIPVPNDKTTDVLENGWNGLENLPFAVVAPNTRQTSWVIPLEGRELIASGEPCAISIIEHGSNGHLSVSVVPVKIAHST